MSSPSFSQVTFLRKIYGSRLNVFAPIHDLSTLSMTGSEGLSAVAGMTNDIAVAGGQILGDEYSEHVLKTRSGVILREGYAFDLFSTVQITYS